VSFAGSSSANEDNVPWFFKKATGIEILNLRLINLGSRKLERIQILMNRELGNTELVLDGTGFAFSCFSQAKCQQDLLYAVIASYPLSDRLIVVNRKLQPFRIVLTPAVFQSDHDAPCSTP